MTPPIHLLSIDDLTDEQIDRILLRAAAHHAGEVPSPVLPRPVVAGLLFGQTSLRTRVGYAAAAARLGWHAVDIPGRRHDPTAMLESWADTLRTLAGYLDVLVARPGEELSKGVLERNLSIPYVNGGGTGPDAEHPTQALVDLSAMQHELGQVCDLTIAVCGDLRMRAARSLLRLLARRPPRRLVVATAPPMNAPLPPELHAITEHRPLADLGGPDVLYVIGMPHMAVPEDVRDTLRVTDRVVQALPDHAVVLSPLPVIDEIDAEAREDHRVRMFQQSDRALAVRMATLEMVWGPWAVRRTRLA